MLDDEAYATVARETVQAFEAEVEQFPWCFVGLLGGVIWNRCGGKTIMVVYNTIKNKNNDDDNANAKIQEALQRLRRKVGVCRTIVAVGNGQGEWLRERNGLVRNLDLSKAGIWICEGRVCRQVRLEDL